MNHDRDDDHRAIERIMLEYCRAVDANEPDDVVALFTHDCITNYGPGDERVAHPTLGFQGEMRGRAEFREFLDGLAGLAGTSHHVSNIQITFTSPDAADAFSYLIAWHLLPDRAEFTVYGRYVDALVRTDAGWQFRSRRMLVAGASGSAAGPWQMLDRRT